jgi:ribosomal protein L11 methyltransferase
VSASSTSSARFVLLRARAAGEAAEIALAEAWAAGAAGAEERSDEGVLIVYADARHADAVAVALTAALGPGSVLGPALVPAADWPESWKQGLRPLVVSERLVVRPPFALHRLAAGQREVVIEPRQAFGTGGHPSTSLALEALDLELAARPAAKVLDVGCGSGVLAIAARVLGAGQTVACDLDPVAARETLENAAANGVGVGLRVFTGSLAAVGPARFDLVVANLLRRELEPLLDALVARVRPGGAIVLSGLLAGDAGSIEARLASLHVTDLVRRAARDAGGETWIAVTGTRGSGGASRRVDA